jgi:hypothetical protein
VVRVRKDVEVVLAVAIKAEIAVVTVARARKAEAAPVVIAAATVHPKSTSKS